MREELPSKATGGRCKERDLEGRQGKLFFDGVTSVCPHTPVPRYVPLATDQWQIVKRTVPYREGGKW